MNTISGASLSSNVVTLPAGTFKLVARAPGYKCDRHRIALYDVTGSAYVFQGANAMTPGGFDTITDAWLRCILTLSTPTAFRIDHRIQEATGTTQTLGRAMAFAGLVEVYTEVFVERLA
jgi:hypothetical protein